MLLSDMTSGTVDSLATMENAERAAGDVPAALRSRQIAEAGQLKARSSTGKVRFTPTPTQIDSAAFKVIVGDAKHTANGTPVGTIYGGLNSNSLAEVKVGESSN